MLKTIKIQRPEVQPKDFDYPSDKSSNEDKIWYMTQIMKRKIVMIQTIHCHHY